MPKLSKFNGNENNTSMKHILIAFGIIICLLAAFGIYRTHAIYTTKQEYDVIRSKIGDFSDSCPVVECEGMSLNECIISLSETHKSVVQQIQPSTGQTETSATTDYRYIGADPCNYVCLEADGKCEEDELYRIIGVIPTQKTIGGTFENRVKLIKETAYIGPTVVDNFGKQGQATPDGKGYYWSGRDTNIVSSNNPASNDWPESLLNKDVLNSTTNPNSYWKSISSYHQYIDDTVWYLGTVGVGDTYPITSYPSTQDFYIKERGTNTDRGTLPPNIVLKSSVPNTTAKIGLIYPSDYGYATSGGSEEKRNECITGWLYDYDGTHWGAKSDGLCMANDWLNFHGNGYNWTITSYGNTPFIAWFIGGTGYAGQAQVGPNFGYEGYAITSVAPNMNVRPVFSLASNVKYNGGTGNYDNPYLISL